MVGFPMCFGASEIVFNKKLVDFLSWSAQALVLIGWIVSACAAGLILFGLFPYFHLNQTASVPLSAFYTALSRPVWSAVVAWVVVACASGNGGEGR